jgi:hypothetical protein
MARKHILWTSNAGWWVLWVVVVWMVLDVRGQATAQLRLTFDGGHSSCTSDMCNATLGEEYTPNFACNDGRGTWNDGVVYFMDPIPANMGYVLLNVTATVFGRFDCNGTNLLEGILFVVGMMFSSLLLPSLPISHISHLFLHSALLSRHLHPNSTPTINAFNYISYHATLYLSHDIFSLVFWISSITETFNALHFLAFTSLVFCFSFAHADASARAVLLSE